MTNEEKIAKLDEDMNDFTTHDIMHFIDWDNFDFPDDHAEGTSNPQNTGGRLKTCRCDPAIYTSSKCLPRATPQDENDTRYCIKAGKGEVMRHYFIVVYPFSNCDDGLIRWCPLAYRRYLEKGVITPCEGLFIQWPTAEWICESVGTPPNFMYPRVTKNRPIETVCIPCDIKNNPNSPWAIGPNNFCYSKNHNLRDYRQLDKKILGRTIHKPTLHTSGRFKGLLEEVWSVNLGLILWSNKANIKDCPPNVQKLMEHKMDIIYDDGWEMVDRSVADVPQETWADVLSRLWEVTQPQPSPPPI